MQDREVLFPSHPSKERFDMVTLLIGLQVDRLRALPLPDCSPPPSPSERQLAGTRMERLSLDIPAQEAFFCEARRIPLLPAG